MVSKYLFRILNENEINENRIKHIDDSNVITMSKFEKNELVVNHCTHDYQKDYPVISITSSLEIAYKNSLGSHIAIVKKDYLNSKYLYDVSTLFLFKKLKSFSEPILTSEKQKPMNQQNEYWSQSKREYCYVLNVQKENYVIVPIKQIKKILDLIPKEEEILSEFPEFLSAKIRHLIDIHPSIIETRGNNNFLRNQLDEIRTDVTSAYSNIIYKYITDNYSDLNDLVYKNGFKIPNEESRILLLDMLSDCDYTYMRQREKGEILLDNLFDNQKKNSPLFPYFNT